jgi:hypothetical protein
LHELRFLAATCNGTDLRLPGTAPDDVGLMMRQSRHTRTVATTFVASIFDTEIRAWRGEILLYRVFWIYGVIGGAIMAILYGVALYDCRVGLQQVLLLCFAGYTVWVLVSIWRCVENTQEAYWGLLARQITVVWAGNAILLLFFLEIDVLERLFGH